MNKMITTNTLCDVCGRHPANRITVIIDGKLLCSLECGIISCGRNRYLEHWDEKCRMINARNNKHQAGKITIFDGRKKREA